MKKYLLIALIFIGLISCNKKVSNELFTDNSKNNNGVEIVSDEIKKIASTVSDISEEYDPNYFPDPVIQTTEELENWLASNDNLILAHFQPSSIVPHFTLEADVLQFLVDMINEAENSTFKLVGHTNSLGDKASNMQLSVQRARKVMEKMINNYGLQLSKLGAYGEGETNPLNDNASIEKRKENSRVELQWTY